MKRTLLTKSADGAAHPGSLFEVESAESSTAILDRLAGLCAGILADGVVTPSEADYFADWVRETTKLKPVWPLTEILKRVQRIYEDGRCDDDERHELKAIMESICGIQPVGSTETPATGPEEAPFDSPTPTSLVFPGRVFALTGLFAFWRALQDQA